MNEIDYSIDKVKLMIKVKWYELRCSFHRHYSEYLKCKLAKKAMRVQELEAENSRLQEHANNLSVEIADLHNRRMIEVRARNQAEAIVEQLVNAIEAGAYIELFPRADLLRFQEWYAKMEAIIAEWKEREE